MVKTSEHVNGVTNGMWKFRDRVTEEELVKLAEEWRDGPSGEKYLSLCIRRCSKDQLAIWFMYSRRNIATHSHEEFFDQMTDRLKRRFGNDFVGWDVSSDVWIVK